jgi:hypothetical protein
MAISKIAVLNTAVVLCVLGELGLIISIIVSFDTLHDSCVEFKQEAEDNSVVLPVILVYTLLIFLAIIWTIDKKNLLSECKFIIRHHITLTIPILAGFALAWDIGSLFVALLNVLVTWYVAMISSGYPLIVSDGILRISYITVISAYILTLLNAVSCDNTGIRTGLLSSLSLLVAARCISHLHTMYKMKQGQCFKFESVIYETLGRHQRSLRSSI